MSPAIYATSLAYETYNTYTSSHNTETFSADQLEAFSETFAAAQMEGYLLLSNTFNLGPGMVPGLDLLEGTATLGAYGTEEALFEIHSIMKGQGQEDNSGMTNLLSTLEQVAKDAGMTSITIQWTDIYNSRLKEDASWPAEYGYNFYQAGENMAGSIIEWSKNLE